MTWLQELEEALDARGVWGRRHHRIVVELRDHIACDPGCERRLGDPRALADQFADELATDAARELAEAAFAALSVTAVVFALALITTPRNLADGLGHSLWLFWPAVLAMVVGSQIALVAGGLASLRALRRRRHRTLPAAEIALIRRRGWIGLGAGIATMAGIELYALDFSATLPGTEVVLIASTGAVAAAALVLAARVGLGTMGIATRRAGPAGTIFADLPALGGLGMSRHPLWFAALASLALGAAVMLLTWHTESSLAEALQRGLFEALAVALSAVLLGPAVGLSVDRAESDS